jgi:hypothetical protein
LKPAMIFVSCLSHVPMLFWLLCMKASLISREFDWDCLCFALTSSLE